MSSIPVTSRYSSLRSIARANPSTERLGLIVNLCPLYVRARLDDAFICSDAGSLALEKPQVEGTDEIFGTHRFLARTGFGTHKAQGHGLIAQLKMSIDRLERLRGGLSKLRTAD
jgi:hypothetical protein